MMYGKETTCECRNMQHIDRTLADGFSYSYFQCPRCHRVEYAPCEAQRLMDYSETHRFLFLDDLVLIWMSIHIGEGPADILSLQRGIFSLTLALSEEEDTFTEDPCFMTLAFGPYSIRVDRTVKTLADMGMLVMTDDEAIHVSLSTEGHAAGLDALRKLTSDQLEKMRSIGTDFPSENPAANIYPARTCDSDRRRSLANRNIQPPCSNPLPWHPSAR